MSEGELIVHEDGGMMLTASDDIIQLAENAEKRIAAVKKIKTIALAVTNSNDWQDEGGKPYLWVSGAEKVARLFNISWRIDEPDVESYEDGHFTYYFKGYFCMGGKEIEAIGSRSSRDPFFGRANKQDKDPATISRGNVKKAAYTNCIGNGITRLLGIRNMTWSELADAGIQRESSGYVDRSAGKVTTQSGPIVPKTSFFKEFGGKPWSEVPRDQLEWYSEAIFQNIEDPAKSRFKAQNEGTLKQIIDEINKRNALNAELDAKAAEE